MGYRNRIVEQIIVGADELRRNPKNFRRHPDAQRAALRAILGDVGIVKSLTAFRHPEYGLTLLDGEARWQEGGDWPVEVVDVDEAEADLVLAALDRIGAQAEIDPAALLAILDNLPDRHRAAAGAAWADSEVRALLEAAGVGRVEPGADTEDVPDDGVEIDDLLAPFPWFGGKARVAGRIWARLGAVENYVEPFCGSAAVLLACPYAIPVRTINDADGFIANFWRAVAADPESVACYADWPVNESDLFARHIWLVRQSRELVRRLETDPEYYDAKIAGWWVWGACAWIGTGWCSGEGPWIVADNEIVNRKLPHLGDEGQGVNRNLPHLGNKGQGVNRKLPHLGDEGRGVNRKLPHLGDEGRGDCALWAAHLQGYMGRLADTLRRVRVCCGDWARVTTPSVTTRHGLTAVLLDPPYGEGEQDYSAGGNGQKQIAAAVWDWALTHGDDPLLRIAVCAYDDGRALPTGWTAMRWTARKGYQTTNGASADNPSREIVYFSPHCFRPGAADHADH